jgi:ankyrin repeat protein
VDCQTNLKYSPLHRCAFYDHRRLASLLILAGADQTVQDADGQTPYECAVEKGNEEMVAILKPLLSSTGENISGLPYATNNPRHPQFRPEARDALFSLFDMEAALQAPEVAEDLTSFPYVTG